jgi:hypothetical protein
MLKLLFFIFLNERVNHSYCEKERLKYGIKPHVKV